MRSIFLSTMFLFCLILAACNNESTEKKTTTTSGEIKEEAVSYKEDTTTMNGYLVYRDSGDVKLPGVLVVHEWWGLNDYAKKRARQLAELGYVAMAVDMFGNGQLASNPDEAMQLAGPFYGDPGMAKRRLDAAIAELKKNPHVDTSKIAAIGYCFGGSMVLNAAKLGSDLDGVVSFHGGLEGPTPDKNLLKAQILVCHGAADNFVSDEDSLNFRRGLDSIAAVYNFKSYPNAKHAFTNPDADENAKKFNLDIAYNEEADKTSWEDMKQFLRRIFE